MQPNYWTGSNEELNQALARLKGDTGYRVPTQGATNIQGGSWSPGQPLVQYGDFGGRYGQQNMAAEYPETAGSTANTEAPDEQEKKTKSGGMMGNLGGALSMLGGGGSSTNPQWAKANPAIAERDQRQQEAHQQQQERLGKIVQLVGMFFGA